MKVAPRARLTTGYSGRSAARPAAERERYAASAEGSRGSPKGGKS